MFDIKKEQCGDEYRYTITIDLGFEKITGTSDNLGGAVHFLDTFCRISSITAKDNVILFCVHHNRVLFIEEFALRIVFDIHVNIAVLTLLTNTVELVPSLIGIHDI